MRAFVEALDAACGIIAEVLWVVWAWLLVFGHAIRSGPIASALLFALLLERFIAVGAKGYIEWEKLFPRKREAGAGTRPGSA